MTRPLEIDVVAEEFKHWRLTRKKKGKIPAHLLEKACELKKHYPGYVVARALKMSGSQIKEILPKPKKALKLDFLSLEPSSFDSVTTMPSFTQPDPGITCTLNKPDGTQLILNLPEAQVTDVLKVFLCSK